MAAKIILRTIYFFITWLYLAQDATGQDKIQRVKSGDYAFAKGEVQVTFSDTVSPTFVKK